MQPIGSEFIGVHMNLIIDACIGNVLHYMGICKTISCIGICNIISWEYYLLNTTRLIPLEKVNWSLKDRCGEWVVANCLGLKEVGFFNYGFHVS